MAHSHDDHADGYHVHAHVSTTKFNLAILGVLIFFTLITVGAYNVRLGEWNLFVAILIATMKAGLVMGFYMHLHWEKGFNKLFFLGSFIFVGIFLGYTVNDTSHRGRQQSLHGVRVDPATGNYAHGTPALIAEQGLFQRLRPEPAVEEGEAAPGDEEGGYAPPVMAPGSSDEADGDADALPTDEAVPTDEAAADEAPADEAPADEAGADDAAEAEPADEGPDDTE